MKRLLALFLSVTMAIQPMAAMAETPLMPGHKPVHDEDEAGLWMLADKAELEVQQSTKLVHDPALNTYVRKLVCAVTAEHCPHIRIYLVDVPYFNASMYPNGMMLVYTGLLMRAENEAQLMHVLGHEFIHYRNRHSLAQYRKYRDSSTAIAIFGLATLGLGMGLVGSLMQLAAMGRFMAYNRDQERECDMQGAEIITALGYEPHAAARIWQNMSAEDKVNPRSKDVSNFFASHPASEERAGTLLKWANDLKPGASPWQSGKDSYDAAIQPWRNEWLAAAVETNDCNVILVMLNRMIEQDPQSGTLRYFLGETYRRRNGTDDLLQARSAYEAAIQNDGPSAAYKGLGIVTMKSGDKSAAQTAFDQYLSKNPEAEDRSMVELYRARL